MRFYTIPSPLAHPFLDAQHLKDECTSIIGKFNRARSKYRDVQHWATIERERGPEAETKERVRAAISLANLYWALKFMHIFLGQARSNLFDALDSTRRSIPSTRRCEANGISKNDYLQMNNYVVTKALWLQLAGVQEKVQSLIGADPVAGSLNDGSNSATVLRRAYSNLLVPMLRKELWLPMWEEVAFVGRADRLPPWQHKSMVGSLKANMSVAEEALRRTEQNHAKMREWEGRLNEPQMLKRIREAPAEATHEIQTQLTKRRCRLASLYLLYQQESSNGLTDRLRKHYALDVKDDGTDAYLLMMSNCIAAEVLAHQLDFYWQGINCSAENAMQGLFEAYNQDALGFVDLEIESNEREFQP